MKSCQTVIFELCTTRTSAFYNEDLDLHSDQKYFGLGGETTRPGINFTVLRDVILLKICELPSQKEVFYRKFQ